jgi:ATP-dependent RNA helicase DeaD
VRKIRGIERIINKKFEKKEIPDGADICEVQLMSLANKIHNTEINHEIDKHLSSINELFADTDKDELIKKFFSVEFTRFYNYYQKSKNLNVSESSRDREGGREGGRDFGGKNDSTRYFINVGGKDGFDWMKLKDFLKEQLDLGRDDVFKVETKDSFSFFNTENELKDKVLAFFTDFKYEGRFVNVEVSENRGGGGRRDRKGGGRRDGGRRDDRRGGGRRDDRKEGSGNRSDRRRSDNSSKPRRSDSGNSGISRPRRSRR